MLPASKLVGSDEGIVVFATDCNVPASIAA